MDIIKANFLHIVGREPKANELAHISGLIKVNNVRDDDAFLTVIVINYANNIANNEAIKKGEDTIKSVLEHGNNEYNNAINKAIRSVEIQANETVNNVVSKSINTIAETASKELAKSANNVNKLAVLEWSVILITIVIMSHVSIYFLVTKTESERISMAWSQGYEKGLIESKDDSIRQAWANTPQGKKAYKMDINGSLSLILTCSADGWKKEKKKNGDKICVPYAANKETHYGWLLP